MILTSRIPLYNMAMLSCVIRSTNFQKNDDRYDKLLFLLFFENKRDNDDDGFFSLLGGRGKGGVGRE